MVIERHTAVMRNLSFTEEVYVALATIRYVKYLNHRTNIGTGCLVVRDRLSSDGQEQSGVSFWWNCMQECNLTLNMVHLCSCIDYKEIMT